MQKTVLFLHIPKAGGSTLQSCIYDSVHHDLGEKSAGQPELNGEVYFYPIGFFKDPGLEPSGNVKNAVSVSRLKAVLGHFSYGIHRYTSTPIAYVTLLRDPVERVISLYYHLVTYGLWRADIGLGTFAQTCPAEGWTAELSRWYRGRAHALSQPFSEEEFRQASRTIVDNDQTRRIAGVEPRFGECDRQTLQQAVDNLMDFDVVGLVERFDESLLMMIRRFGWNAKLKYLPRLLNRSKPKREEIPAPVRELIQERNTLDLELYRRGQERFEKALARQESNFGKQLEEFRERNRLHHSENEHVIRAWEIRTDG